MTPSAVALLAVFLLVTFALTKPLGHYMSRVMDGDIPGALRPLKSVERAIYRVCGVDPADEMGWGRYAIALLVFNALGVLIVYLLQRLQGLLPLNPQRFPAVTADSAFNTAVSFATNTNWQGYSGESTMSYLTQMAGLAVQNFLSAATGIAVAFALIRGFARRESRAIGHFWSDVTRATLYVLLPIATVIAVVLVSQGTPQNFDSYKDVRLLEPLTYEEARLDAAGNPVKDASGHALTVLRATKVQTLPMGPMASQEAIKELGTNGGGFVNANSAHPFENPTPLADFLELLAIVVIPAALTYSFGRAVGDTRQGWALLAAMVILFVAEFSLAAFSEQAGNPHLVPLGVDQSATALQPGGNMEGKEARFGIADSVLFTTLTTATSCGAVNSMLDSYLPLGGFVPLFNMMLGEVVFGGVGTGLYSMLVFAIIGVFIAGLMIGRTPEYLGKKVESFEMKMSAVAILVMPFLVLAGTALAVLLPAGAQATANPGAHGFAEILYAFTSAANNNGSAFGGISANSPFYNVALGIVMWLGRFWPIVAVLAIAGSLAAKKRIPVSSGTLPTHGPIFVMLLIGTVLLVGALTFVPALALGPVVEHLMLWSTG